MGVHIIDPLADPRWDPFLLRHRHASAFHTRGWLSALRETYGYTPVAFTTSPPGVALANSLLFCDVQSRLTGRRLVSLPFSDHCDPLVTSSAEGEALLAQVRERFTDRQLKYVELRPSSIADPNEKVFPSFRTAERFLLHLVSLDRPVDDLFRGLHKDSIQRKVRRAEREGLTSEKGRGEAVLREFYRLLLATRKRQGLPPQPLQWFRHLITFMGEALTIRVASKDGRPVAAILTLAFKNTVTYKYGCSDARFNNLGGMPFLFWHTIQEAKGQGMTRLDLGRSEIDNAGLIQFKDRLGANRVDLQYYRMTRAASAKRASNPLGTRLLRWLTCHTPDALLVAAGRFLYRHVG